MNAKVSNQKMIPSSARPIRLRMRPDLQSDRQIFQGRECWVVKDPISLKYYRFEEEEFALLNWLDGKSSAAQIKCRFETQFAPQRLSFPELYHLIGMLHRSSLLIGDAAGQGRELFRRDLDQRSRQMRQSLAAMLSFRFRGFDPDNLLGRLNKYTSWLFTVPMLTLAILLGFAAAGLVFANFETFQAKLPSFQDFFAGRNWIYLAIVLGITKVIHEFGHGLACKRFGGQCHEMGVMFLVFTPCLYCNVSDSWTLPNKWHRIAISAAGIYFELILAAIATWVWWLSQPGAINQLALNVMFVCSVSTLLFNANPLMKYDGYYVLSDWLEIPNLRQKSNMLLNRWLASWFLGMPGKIDPFLPVSHRWLFVSYSVAAAAYRWLITFSIFWFLYHLLEPYGIKIIGQLLAIAAISSLVVMPLRQVIRFFSLPGRWATVNRPRFYLSTCLAGGLLGLMFVIPLPHEIRCPFIVESFDGRKIFVEQPGIVSDVFVKSGDFVRTGQALMRLQNIELEMEIARMVGELDASRAGLEVTQNWSTWDEEIASEVPAALAACSAAENKLKRRLVDLERLTIVAPTSGWLLPMARRGKPDPNSEVLPTWHGNPLDQKNVGAALEAQTQLGQIVNNRRKLQAVLIVDQSDVEYVGANQAVKLWIRELPSTIIYTRTETVSAEQLKDVPRALSTRFGGEVVTTLDEQQREKPASTTYQVNAPFEMPNDTLLPGATGIARVRVGSQTLAQRLWRAMIRTFRFDL